MATLKSNRSSLAKTAQTLDGLTIQAWSPDRLPHERVLNSGNQATSKGLLPHPGTP